MVNDSSAIKQIVNSQDIYLHFGYWPDFHDAEVVQVSFDSHATGRYSVTFLLKTAEFTNELDEHGHYALFRPCNIKLQFTGIHEVSFTDFYFQNVLLELKWEQQNSLIKCVFIPSQGMSATIIADEAIILSITDVL
ncbi:hypothetical protein GCM10027422_44250 [Hymenobacter arcticus]